jgi:glycine/D-amino acid oxidase-like deaminating enzyme
MNLKSGLPYSLIKNGLPYSYPKLDENIRTPVLIMGGGISGALTAYHLIEHGIECTIVDARTIGLGSTCASTSLLQYEIDIPLYKLEERIGKKEAAKAYLLCKEAIYKLIEVASHIGYNNIQKKNSLYYAATIKDAVGLKKEYDARKKNGFDVNFLEGECVFNETGIDASAAILSSDAAQTDAYLLTHALLQHCLKKGLNVFDRTNVISINHKPKSVELFTENGYVIKTKKLVYATGYETVKYIDKPIVKLLSTYATISEPLTIEKPFWKKDSLLWNTANPYLYMRATNDNRILVGGRDENFYSPKKRDKLISSKTKKLTADFYKTFPLINFIPEFSWTGTFGSTKDGLPYIGPYKKLQNSLFALGFGGNGITFSLVAAEIITDILLNKRNSDISLFSFER